MTPRLSPSPAASRWIILGVCTLSFLQTHIHRTGFAPLIPTFIAELGLTYAAAGTLMTAYFWTYTAAQIPIGIFTDRWGSRRVMIVFMAILALGAVAFPLSRSYPQSLIARALVGLGAAAVWVPGMRLITEWFPLRERGRAIGIFSSGGAIGGTVGLLVIPLLADRWGWRLGYASTLLPALVTLTLIVLFVLGSQAPSQRESSSPGSAPAGGTLAALWHVLASREVWPFNLTMLLFNGGYFSMLTWTPAFLVRQMGMTQSEAGFVTSLITAGAIIAWPLLGVLTDRLGRRKLVVQLSLVGGCLAGLAFAWVVPDLPRWGVAMAALGSGIGMAGTIFPTVMAVETFPRELAGTVTSVVNTFFFIGALTVPVLFGRVVDLTGSFPLAFVAAGMVQALALVAACFIREPGRGR